MTTPLNRPLPLQLCTAPQPGARAQQGFGLRARGPGQLLLGGRVGLEAAANEDDAAPNPATGETTNRPGDSAEAT